MKITPTAIPDVLLIEPRVFGDARGFFFESFNQKSFAEATGVNLPFVQDNHSKSVKGVLRGLHYQLEPHAQGKLVRVTQAERSLRWDDPTLAIAWPLEGEPILADKDRQGHLFSEL